jgi:hypothetical protein
MLSSHLRLGLLSGFIPSVFPTKTLYAFLISHMCSHVQNASNTKVQRGMKIAKNMLKLRILPYCYTCRLSTYLFSSNSIEHSPSWETDGCSVFQEFPCLLWKPKVYYRVDNAPNSVMSEMNPVYVLTFQLITSTELKPFWQVTSRLASQEIAQLLWKTKIHCRVHKSPPLDPS